MLSKISSLLIFCCSPLLILMLWLWINLQDIIRTLPIKANHSYQILIYSLIAILSINIGYAWYCNRKNKEIGIFFTVFNVVIFSCYITNYYFQMSAITSNISQVIDTDSFFYYPIGFLLIPLMYNLIIIANYSLKKTDDNIKEENKNHLINFVLIILIPISFYFSSYLIICLTDFQFVRLSSILLFFIFIVTAISFLFFMLRTICLILKKRKDKKDHENIIQNKINTVFKVVVSLFLPTAGLVLNYNMHFIFGEFDGISLYILVITTAFFVSMPRVKNNFINLILFIGSCVTFSYTLYFFAIFLPLFPLAILALLVFGAGFLMMVPILLFLIHSQVIISDISSLAKNAKNKPFIGIIFIVSFLSIPSYLYIKFNNDRQLLHEALEYTFSCDYQKNYKFLNSERTYKNLKQVIANITAHTTTSREGLSSNGKLPFISGLYRYIVLDNLTLSRQKKEYLQRIFLARIDHQDNNTSNVNFIIEDTPEAHIQNLNSTTFYDTKNKFYKSTLKFKLKNSYNRDNIEFKTTFNLPNGCYISDYYLYIEGRKERGILAEKRAATWIYSQIKKRRQDPGILNYISGNKIKFRVFPFLAKELRETEIELIHKDPITIKVQNYTLKLNDKNSNFANRVEEIITADNYFYISANAKNKLPLVKRKPYFHFLIDNSIHSKSSKTNFKSYIKNFLKQYPKQVATAKFSLVSSSSKIIATGPKYENEFDKISNNGGFFLDQTIRKNLVFNYLNKNSNYPVFIVVSKNLNNAIINKNFADLNFCYPDNEKFYCLNNNKGELISFSLKNNSKHPIAKTKKISLNNEVRVFNYHNKIVGYLKNDDQASIILTNDQFPTTKFADEKAISHNYESALLMQAKYQAMQLKPVYGKTKFLELVQDSFKSQIMNPFTSFIALENDQQKIALQRKQKETLKANKNLDANQEIEPMSEPKIWILIVIILAFFITKKWYSKIIFRKIH
ncbi:MSEP-CTERM sorting domain-containing protein [Lentisphaerota bacterium WC36G]|nr:MSEP-CTERM sorting domain-containing protein [Lentisphaerae bacterium WC36]